MMPKGGYRFSAKIMLKASQVTGRI